MKLNVQRWFEYRLNFVIGIVAIAMTNLATITFLWAIFRHIPLLNGWTFDQLLFMFGFLVFAAGIWHVFLAEASAWGMEHLVRQGKLDRLLLRPMNTLVMLCISRLDDDGFGDMFTGLALLVYSSHALGIVWTAQNLLMLAVLTAGALLIWFSVNVIVAATAFWATSVRSLMDVLWNMSRFVEYPINIYHAALVWFLTYVIPLGFVNFYPSQYFFQNSQWTLYAFATLPVGLVTLAVAYAVWSYGLKNYSSTGT
jgi:ABC-2 type transport system permease protein